VQAEWRLTSGDFLRIAALITVTVGVVAGAAQATFDSGEFRTLWDGVWWATTTMTTVGYGDLYPTTVEGRLIGILVMVVGVASMSLLTAAIASRFVRMEREPEKNEVLEALQRLEVDVREIKAKLR
jgi:voltage-gated potassium channel